MESVSRCWEIYEGDALLEEYHDSEWCRVSHDERYLFEMLCLEGASVGLSWRTIMHKREAYKKAYFDFDVARCAAMTDKELSYLLNDTGLIRNRAKIFGVRKNAQVVLKIQEEYGSFDAYVWSFTKGKRIDGKWRSVGEIPVENEVSRKMSADMKKRGMVFVGPIITYSFMQAVGIVNDHLRDCPNR
ncbi:DNA-3-methyladenine glycosylase I [bacterium]|nr:DNA-3-methyladenine glycosylase I [bacterium]